MENTKKKPPQTQQWDSSVTLQKVLNTTQGIIYHDSSV